jgi:hypothetical protein
MAVLATVVMPYQSGLPKDVAVNNFVIGGASGSDPVDAQLSALKIRNIYTENMIGGSITLGSRLSPVISRAANACKIKLYDISAHLDGTAHGSPFDEISFTMPSTTEGPLPGEVACVVTLEAHGREDRPVEGTGAAPRPRPRQRSTGRIYVGPLSTAFLDTGSGGSARPNTTLMTRLRDTFAGWFDQLEEDADGMHWVGVWSRREATVRAIANVVTDDSFDTIRSRGETPTARIRTAVPQASNVELAA